MSDEEAHSEITQPKSIRTIRCVSCGYDLSHTPPDGVCPECSTSCQDSCWILSDDFKSWERIARYGLLLVGLGILIRCVTPFIWGWYLMSVGPAGDWPSFWIMWAVSSPLAYVPIVVGAFLITKPRLYPHLSSAASPWRHIARWALIIGGLGDIVEPFARGWLRNQIRWSEFYEQDIKSWLAEVISDSWSNIVTILIAVGLVALLRMLYDVAREAQAQRLSKWIRTVAWILGCLYVTFALRWMAFVVPVPGLETTLIDPLYVPLGITIMFYGMNICSTLVHLGVGALMLILAWHVRHVGFIAPSSTGTCISAVSDSAKPPT